MKTAMKCLMVPIIGIALMSTALMAGDWTPIYEGVWYRSAEKTSPRLMKAFAFKIDLTNPYVSFYATPSNGGTAYETVMRTVPNFRSTYGLEAAINANFFVSHSPNAEIEGLLISNGTTVSYDQAYRQAQLRITSAKVATILGTGGNPGGIHTAVAGDAYHLVNGTALGDNGTTAPRTSVGISQNGRYLIMCVVDGRQPGWSDGATILDMSHWMLDFGAWNAINLDGGGSSTICSASGGVYNRPSDGAPRSVGASLGVNSAAVRAFPRIMPSGGWYLNNSNTDGTSDINCAFGGMGDIALAGDWDGNGTVTPGIFRGVNNFLLNNGFDGTPELDFGFGTTGDIPLVGDWDGDGDDTIGVYRPSERRFYLRNTNSAGGSDITVIYGTTGDRPIVGDWDGNGTDTIGVYRPSTSDFHLNNGFDGTAEYSFHYGTTGDYPVVGDWDGNGTYTVGVRRSNMFYLRNAHAGGSADISQPYGEAYGTPIVGDWDGNGTVTIGIIQ